MKNVLIVSGFNSDLATPYVRYFSQQVETHIIGLYNNKNILPKENITPVQCDLLCENTATLVLNKVFCSEQFSSIEKVLFLHFVGGFKYEGLVIDPQNDLDGDGIDDEVYCSNVKTFDHVYQSIQQCMHKSWKDTHVTLFNIGSKRDFDPNVVPWPSYAHSKNILREKFKKYVATYDRMSALFVNAGTINTKKERTLRPHGDHAYRLSPQEVFDSSISFLESVNGYKEIEVYKTHPDYHCRFEKETIYDTDKRWLREMGMLGLDSRLHE